MVPRFSQKSSSFSPLFLLLTALLWTLPAVMAPASLAHAAPAEEVRSLVVLNMEGEGVSEKTLETLDGIVRDQAQQLSRFRVVNKAVLTLSEVTMALGCDHSSVECMRETTAQIGEKRLVYGFLMKEADGVRIKLEMFDEEQGRVTYRHQALVPLQDDMVLAFRKEIEEFFGQMRTDQQAATLVITSNVRGAAVSLNGKQAGVTPFEHTQLSPGTYRIEVKNPGFSPWSATLDLERGSTLKMSAKLRRNAENVGPVTLPGESPGEVQESVQLQAPARGGQNWGAISLMTLGGAALVTSAITGVMMANTQDELSERNRPGELTRQEYDDLVRRGGDAADDPPRGAGRGACGRGSGWGLVGSSTMGTRAPSESALAPGMAA